MAERVKKARSPWGGPLVLLGDVLLTACALTGFVFSFFTLYEDSLHSYPKNALSLFFLEFGAGRLGAISLLLSLLTALVWSLPRFRRPVLGLLTAGLAGWVLLIRKGLWSGAQLTAKVIADLFEDRVGWFGTLRLDLDLTAAQELTAVKQFLLPAILLLALLLGWAIVRSRRWWMVVLLTLPPLLPGLLADVYPNWPAFVLLCCCWCTMLLISLCKWAAPSGRGKLTLAALPAVGAMLALISLAAPLEGYERPQWTYTVEDALVDFGNRRLSFLSGLEGPFTSRVTYVGSAEAVNLDSAGPLNFSGRTVLKVTSEDYTGSVYLRGTSLAYYSDNRWEDMDSSTYRRYSDQLNDTYSPFPLTFPASAAGDTKAYTVTVENTGASGTCAYAPYHLTDQDWTDAGMLPVQDAYLAREEGQWSHTFTFIPDLSPGYNDSSVLPSKARYTPFVTEHYLDVPDELREGLLTLMGGQFDALAPLDAAEAIAAYLADTCRYDPDAPAVPEGEDFVDYFLTDSRRGYCMHFASAATLMLRCLDIPTRYVSGFTADVTAGKTVYVPDSASHAWVEVYVDGYGWQPVEVTPGYEEEPLVSDEPQPSEQPSDTPELPGKPPEVSDSPKPSLSPLPSESQTVNQQLPSEPGGLVLFLRGLVRVLKWLALAAAVVVVVWLGQYLPRKHRAKKLLCADANRAVLYGYRCLTRLEKWGGTIPTDILELAQKARFSQHTLSEDERWAVVGCFDDQRRELARTLSPIKKSAFRYFWGWPKEEVHDYP